VLIASGSIVIAVAVLVVSIALILLSGKRSGTITRRTRIASPERMEKLLASHEVQEQLRAQGIDPAVLEANLRSGKATFEDGKIAVFGTTVGSTTMPPQPMAGAKPLSPEEAARFFQDPAMREQLRKDGIDPDEAERKVASGETTVFGTETTFFESGAPPPGILDDAKPLPPEEAARILHDPALQEQLRKAGIDPEEFERGIASGQTKVLGTEASIDTSLPAAAPDTAELSPPVAVPPPPPEPQRPLTSDDGDDVWKTGKL
jgi:hypothetical protein